MTEMNDPFTNVQAGKITNAHGEVNFFRIDKGDVDLTGFTPAEPTPGKGYIVGHSETGHHHVLERASKVYTGTHKGMEILYAIVDEPSALKQDASSPHAGQIVQPGNYLITNNVEVDPLTKLARRVAD